MTRIAIVRAAISSDKSSSYCLALVLAALLAATSARWVLADVAGNLTFVTYFPAILVCSLLTGWRYGTACAVLSGAIVESLFLPGATGLTVLSATLTVFLTSSAVLIATADTLRRTIRELDSANELARTLNRELQHRVANMLTVVQALASQSAKRSSPQEFVTAFSGRLQALATAHELLGRRNVESCTLPELIDEASQPFCAGGNIIKSGPACKLPAESCVPLVLAVHELCTNALKYGALSTPEGSVRISWAFAEEPDRLTVEWQEIGGPVVVQPTRKGLGSSLLRAQPGIAEVTTRFDKTGVNCKIVVDGAELLEKTVLENASLENP